MNLRADPAARLREWLLRRRSPSAQCAERAQLPCATDSANCAYSARGGAAIAQGALTDGERRLLAGCPSDLWELVEAAKVAFAPLGGLTVEAVIPFKSAARDEAARLVRAARRRGDGTDRALLDAFTERIADCTVDGEVSLDRAEEIAAEELRCLINPHNQARPPEVRIDER